MGGGGVGLGGGGQDGCERRIEVFVKIKNKWPKGQQSLIQKIHKKNIFWGGGRVGEVGGGGGQVGGSG